MQLPKKVRMLDIRYLHVYCFLLSNTYLKTLWVLKRIYKNMVTKEIYPAVWKILDNKEVYKLRIIQYTH